MKVSTVGIEPLTSKLLGGHHIQIAKTTSSLTIGHSVVCKNVVSFYGKLFPPFPGDLFVVPFCVVYVVLLYKLNCLQWLAHLPYGKLSEEAWESIPDDCLFMPLLGQDKNRQQLGNHAENLNRWKYVPVKLLTKISDCTKYQSIMV